MRMEENDNNQTKRKIDRLLAEKDKLISKKEREILEKEMRLKDLHQSKIVRPAIMLQSFLRSGKKKLLEVEAAVFRLAKKHLGEQAMDYLAPVFRRKFKTRQVCAKNEKWDGPLVSAVTPYYNRAETIQKTIASVLGQTFQNFEYIIVDDGSIDEKSIKVFDKIENPKIEKIRQKNQGVAAARNAGIAQAKGKYIICLDSDDNLDPTYIEKMAALLETNPECDIAYSHIQSFGFDNEIYREPEFDAKKLYRGNFLTTAAMFRKEYWKKAGGYKPEIGYEDWELWLNMVEHGACARLFPEAIFHYRREGESRYTHDLKKDRENAKKIRELHPRYLQNIKKFSQKFIPARYVWKDNSQYVNLEDAADYRSPEKEKKNVLVLLNWLTFGGAETVVYNFCSKLKDKYNFYFVTGLPSENEWESKFRGISDNIFHLPNLFRDEKSYEDFVANFVKTRSIDVAHIIHSSVFFPMLEGLKKKFPKLEIVNTAFNTKADHFWNAKKIASLIDIFTTDNTKVVPVFEENFPRSKPIKVIPNGIDCHGRFNFSNYDRERERGEMGIEPNDVAVYFISRLSEEKGIDIFLKAAKAVLQKKSNNIKFFVIGDGPMKGKVLHKIRKAGNQNLKYLGYQEDIPKFLSTADVFVLPSRIEGFPVSNVEAMAMKVCVIAADVGGVSDAVQDGKTGFLVPQDDPQAIADRIMMLANDGELAKKVAEEGRKAVEEKFSVEAMAEQYGKIYGE